MTTPNPGIYPGLPFAEYQKIEAVNNSLLWTLKTRSPLHAKWERDHPEEPTPALLFGSAWHTLTLEPTQFDKRYSVRPECDRRTKEGKAIYEAFCETKGDRQEVTTDDYAKMKAMTDAVRAQQCHEYICSGRAELTMVWEDKETGILMKRRLDFERSVGWNHYETDLKSTEDASRDGFSRSIANYGYFQEAAISVDGWKVLTGDDSLYAWLACEKSEPHVTKAWECDEDTLEAGRKSYCKALQTYAECIEQDEWPAYGDGVDLISAPEWLLRREGISQFAMI